ncbi:ZIP family metal transporter [Candidatus Pacearchaeota archaeon]|nr:ZIP family metal transporter [Candidatus Pacearchaeota archaeon]
MQLVWLYVLSSVLIISLISFIGVFTLSINTKRLHKILIYLVSFAAGALLGDAFLHLIPELIEENSFTLSTSFWILGGIVLFFIIEKIVRWQHCHLPQTKEHKHPFAIINLVGDGFHNLIDGLIIGASYIVSIPLGLATTLAVIFHEIPQEISDFGVLLQGGFSKKKALLFNFLSACTAILGAIIALVATKFIPLISQIILPIAIGGFVYIAGADLIPELHKNVETKKSILQLVALIIGILVMASLLLLE